MKILKRGKKELPEAKIYVKKCNTCGCSFTYKNRECKYNYDEQRYILCPQCNYKVFIVFRKKYRGVM